CYTAGGGDGSGDGDTDGGSDGEGDLDLLRDKDGKSDGDGKDDDGKSGNGGEDDDGISDGSSGWWCSSPSIHGCSVAKWHRDLLSRSKGKGRASR
ncbi:hypothetical protein Tco_0119470, partial [Tanacetum coccineum]